MVLYFYGLDSYRRSKTLKEKVFSVFEKKHPNGSIDYFDLAVDGKLDKLFEFSKGKGLFSSVKLGIIQNPQEAEAKVLIGFLKSYLDDKETTIVVESENKLVKKFDFLLAEPAKSWEFKPLENTKILSFVKELARERKIEINTEQIKLLVSAFGSDLWAISAELEKMSLGASDPKVSVPFNFIELIKSFAYGRSVGDRLRALYFLLENNDSAAIFNMAAAFSGGKAKIVYADYDVAVKSGKLNFEEALVSIAVK